MLKHFKFRNSRYKVYKKLKHFIFKNSIYNVDRQIQKFVEWCGDALQKFQDNTMCLMWSLTKCCVWSLTKI